MKLPNGHLVVVSDEKLLGFLLNPDHEHGSSHARLFRALLGIDRSNAEQLRAALLAAAAQEEATPGRRSDFGQKYEVRFRMTGPRGTYIMLSVWMVETGQSIPRLVTAFVE
jgi:hypothetical protein